MISVQAIVPGSEYLLARAIYFLVEASQRFDIDSREQAPIGSVLVGAGRMIACAFVAIVLKWHSAYNIILF